MGAILQPIVETPCDPIDQVLGCTQSSLSEIPNPLPVSQYRDGSRRSDPEKKRRASDRTPRDDHELAESTETVEGKEPDAEVEEDISGPKQYHKKCVGQVLRVTTPLSIPPPPSGPSMSFGGRIQEEDQPSHDRPEAVRHALVQSRETPQLSELDPGYGLDHVDGLGEVLCVVARILLEEGCPPLEVHSNLLKVKLRIRRRRAQDLSGTCGLGRKTRVGTKGWQICASSGRLEEL